MRETPLSLELHLNLAAMAAPQKSAETPAKRDLDSKKDANMPENFFSLPDRA